MVVPSCFLATAFQFLSSWSAAPAAGPHEIVSPTICVTSLYATVCKDLVFLGLVTHKQLLLVYACLTFFELTFWASCHPSVFLCFGPGSFCLCGLSPSGCFLRPWFSWPYWNFFVWMQPTFLFLVFINTSCNLSCLPFPSLHRQPAHDSSHPDLSQLNVSRTFALSPFPPLSSICT